MARIVSGGSKLFTSEAFTKDYESQPVKTATGGQVRLSKFLQGLKVADELASNKLIGAGVGLLGQGIKAIGQYQAEQAKLSEAEKAVAEQTALNKAEAEQATAEQKALQAKAQEKLGMQAVASPEEVAGVEGGLGFRQNQDKYFEGLRQVIGQYQADAKLAPKIGDYLRQGVKSGFITDDQAKKVAGALEVKATGREQELLQQQKALPTEQEVARPAVELAMKEQGIAKDVRAKIPSGEETQLLESNRVDSINRLRQVIREANAGQDITKMVSGDEELDVMYDLINQSKERLQEAQTELSALDPASDPTGAERNRLEIEIESQKQSVRDMQRNVANRQVSILNNTIQGIEDRQSYDPNAEYTTRMQPVRAEAERMRAETEAERRGVKPPAPAEPTAPQPQEEVLPFAVKPRVQREFEEKVLPRGKDGLVKVLQALEDIKGKSGGKLTQDQQQLYDLSINELRTIVNKEREVAGEKYLTEARAEEARAITPQPTETMGRVTDAKGRVIAEEEGTRLGERVAKKPIPEMRAKGLTPAQTQARLEAFRDVGGIPTGMTIVDEGLGEEVMQPTESQFKSLEAQQVLDLAVKEPNEARKKALVEEAKRLEEQATAKGVEAGQLLQRQAKLPAGVSRDETGKLVVEPTKTFSETELLGLASQADTLEERKQVLDYLQNQTDVAPTSVLDIMTGAHKTRFAERVRTFFPTGSLLPRKPTKTQAEIDADIALKTAKRQKILAEIPEVTRNAESLRATRQSQIDRNTAGANDLRAKTDAEVNGVDYWKSVIIKNLRRPAGRAGKSRAEIAKQKLALAEQIRAKQKGDTEKSHDALIGVTKAEVNGLKAKADTLAKEFGDQPTAPSEPDRGAFNTSKAYNEAKGKYEKDKKTYDDNVKAQAELNKRLKDAEARLQKEEQAKQRDLDDIDKAYDEVAKPLERETFGRDLPKKRGAPETKRPKKPAEDLFE